MKILLRILLISTGSVIIIGGLVYTIQAYDKYRIPGGALAEIGIIVGVGVIVIGIVLVSTGLMLKGVKKS